MTADERPGKDCFISYSWDSENHRQWVIGLGTELRKNGVDVRLDAWHTMLGDDLPQFMEDGIRDCNHVVIVCTPNYAEKANSRRGGAGYESAVITGEIFQKVAARGKFIPILRAGEPDSALPSYLKGKYYVDFREDSDFGASLESLLRHVHQVPQYPCPEIGPAPSLGGKAATGHTETVSKSVSAEASLREEAMSNQHDEQSPESLYYLAIGGTITLTQHDKNRLTADQLNFLAIGKQIVLSQHDKDRLTPESLYYLAIDGTVKLNEKDRARLSQQQLYLLKVGKQI